jgi:hypothetical protein
MALFVWLPIAGTLAIIRFILLEDDCGADPFLRLLIRTMLRIVRGEGDFQTKANMRLLGIDGERDGTHAPSLNSCPSPITRGHPLAQHRTGRFVTHLEGSQVEAVQ